MGVDLRGYRSWAGLRTMGRRWGDLIEAGLGCSQDAADRLVKSGLIDGPDRGLQGADAGTVVSDDRPAGGRADRPVPDDWAGAGPFRQAAR